MEKNDATINLLECSREELVSKTIFDFLYNQQDISYIRQELTSKGFIYDRATYLKLKSLELKIV